MDKKVFTVSQVNQYIKAVLEQDYILQHIWIQGEISNYKYHSSGHLYFTLKDPFGAIACVMFRSHAGQIPFEPQNGMAVVVRGYISLYEKTGQYQIYVEKMEPEGKGALYAAFEQLKERLQKEGLFDSRYKKPIPQYPQTVGVITSPTGAAVQDIIQIARRRNPGVKIVIYPVLVQGRDAKHSIAEAIEKINRWGAADVLIVGRGGGSLEDLWAFNEEVVARAIFQSRIPIISAVGHETDYTIADFVADLRAPTPSAAAELAVFDHNELASSITQTTQRLSRLVHSRLEGCTQQFVSIQKHGVFRRPLDAIYQKQLYMDQLGKNIQKDMLHRMENYKHRFVHSMEQLEALSPFKILKRGYSMMQNEKGQTLSSIHQVAEKEKVHMILYDGIVDATIERIEEKEREDYGEKKTNDF